MNKRIGFVLLTCLPALAIWSCSNAPPYGGGGRDLGPQGMPMGAADTGPTDSGTDTGIKPDTGVDTGTQ